MRVPEPLDLKEAQRAGRQLVADLLSRLPESSVRTNTLRIRPPGAPEKAVQVRFAVALNGDGWVSTYETLSPPEAPGSERLKITVRPGQPNQYLLTTAATAGSQVATRPLEGNQTMASFAGSDFWVADLGLEFLHWPKQLLLRKELRKGQSCDVLESINPTPAPGAYSRIVSWIDIDTGGIVHADAYDAEARILKLFDPSELQKVDGRMQVKEIEIRNRQTGSRSWVSFELR